MREIKFRGKEVETGQWVYGKLIENKNKGKGLFSGYHYIVPFDIIPYAGNNEHTITSGGYPDYAQDDYSHCWKERKALTIAVIEVDNDTIGQYTGLKDKNGKEVYEGDIVRFEDIGEDGYEYKEGFDFENDAQVIYEDGQVTLTNFGEWENSHYATDGQPDILDEILRNGNCEVIGNIYDNPELLEV